MEHLLHTVVEAVAMVAEVSGVVIIVVALLQALYKLVAIYKFDFNKAHHDTTLGKGLSYALGILMIGEIMETIVGATIPGLITIGALVIVRFMFVLIISFETKHAEHEEHAEHNQH